MDTNIPPHSAESERAILASVLLEPGQLPALTPEHFYFDAHQRIYQALLETGGDIVAVCNSLHSAGQLGRVGGQRYVASLVLDDDEPIHDLSAHVEIVTEAWRNRRLLRVLQTVAAELYSGLSARDAWQRVREECAA